MAKFGMFDASKSSHSIRTTVAGCNKIQHKAAARLEDQVITLRNTKIGHIALGRQSTLTHAADQESPTLPT